LNQEHVANLWNINVIVTVKVHTLDIAPLRSESSPQKRSGMACVSRDFTVVPAYPHVYPHSE